MMPGGGMYIHVSSSLRDVRHTTVHMNGEDISRHVVRVELVADVADPELVVQLTLRPTAVQIDADGTTVETAVAVDSGPPARREDHIR